MKHIILVTGYPGAGKTTLLKNLHKESTNLETYWRCDSPFSAQSLRGLPKHSQVGSKWSFDDIEYVTAGCFRKSDTKKQGSDIFVSTPKYEVIDWLLTKGDILIWESFNIGPQMVNRCLQRGQVTYLQLELPRETAMERRDLRRDVAHGCAKAAADLQHFYDGVERRWERANLTAATCITTKDALPTLKKVLKKC